jgi:acyl-CoA synthetase (AMP-forming)/AMP-acid ligase II
MNICGEFAKISNQWPTHTAVVYKSERITYAELEKTVQVLKDDLRRIGIEPGHKVGVLFPNGPGHVAATLAIRWHRRGDRISLTAVERL